MFVENSQLHSKGFVLLCDCILYYILQDGCFFKEEETKQLCAKSDDKNFKGVDMLLTSDWPKDVTQYGNKLVCHVGGYCACLYYDGDNTNTYMMIM